MAPENDQSSDDNEAGAANWSQDPWRDYAWLRSTAPVFSYGDGVWLLSRHADCLRLLRDRRASSDVTNLDPALVSRPGTQSVRRVASPTEQQLEKDNRPFLFRDPPDHTRLRALVSKAFTPRMVQSLRPRVEEITAALLAQMLEHDEVDVVASLAYPLPVQVICEMLGVPADDRHRFGEWSAILARGLDPEFLLPPEIVTARAGAALAFGEYFSALVAERRQHPGRDLLSRLVQVKEGSDVLTEGELLSTAVLLLIAGHETTAGLISGGLLALLEHPDELARLRAEYALLTNGVDELLRYVSPVQLTERILLESQTIGGTTLPVGCSVVALLASANRDPEVFTDPDRLDLSRQASQHLGFGFGLHHCMGAPLARMETQVALNALLRRTRDLALADRPVRYRPNVVLRGLEELYVQLVPA